MSITTITPVGAITVITEEKIAIMVMSAVRTTAMSITTITPVGAITVITEERIAIMVMIAVRTTAITATRAIKAIMVITSMTIKDDHCKSWSYVIMIISAQRSVSRFFP